MIVLDWGKYSNIIAKFRDGRIFLYRISTINIRFPTRLSIHFYIQNAELGFTADLEPYTSATVIGLTFVYGTQCPTHPHVRPEHI